MSPKPCAGRGFGAYGASTKRRAKGLRFVRRFTQKSACAWHGMPGPEQKVTMGIDISPLPLMRMFHQLGLSAHECPRKLAHVTRFLKQFHKVRPLPFFHEDTRCLITLQLLCVTAASTAKEAEQPALSRISTVDRHALEWARSTVRVPAAPIRKALSWHGLLQREHVQMHPVWLLIWGVLLTRPNS